MPSTADYTSIALRQVLWCADRAMGKGSREWAEGFVALAFDLLDSRVADLSLVLLISNPAL